MAIWYVEPCPDFVLPPPALPDGFELPEDFKPITRSFEAFVKDTLSARHILKPRYLECKESIEKQLEEMAERGYLALDGTDREFLLLVCAEPEFQQPDDSAAGWRWCRNWPYDPRWCARYVGPCVAQIKAASKVKPAAPKPAPPDAPEPDAPAQALAAPEAAPESADAALSARAAAAS